MNLPIYQRGTAEADTAIKNALAQHEFYLNKKLWGPAYDESERRKNAEIFAKVHPSFILKSHAGTVEVCTYYKEKKNTLVYHMRIYLNNQPADINLIKHFLSDE